MTRLFLSLYVFITITLILLSAVLNYFFFSNNEDEQPQQYLVNTLTVLHEQSKLDQEQLDQIGLTWRITDIGNIPWSEADQVSLAAKQAVLLYDSQSNAQMYLLINEETLFEIDLPSTVSQQDSFYWYSASFFVLLALGTAIWIWPLWRDLQLLKSAAKQTNLSQKFEPIALESHSLVYPVGLALDELNAKVRELIKTQMELTGSVAHEFRTPLSRLKFALEAASIDDQAALTAINQDILELETLMHEMLSYTSLENQQPELNISQIPLLSLCQQRIDVCAPEKKFNITLSGENLIVLGDEHFIERAFDNLFQNALCHTKSKIVVHIEQKKSQIILSIDDDGSGIDAAHTQRIFEPFFRPDHGRTRNRGGAGLGLAIVKRIALWHNAKCWTQASPFGGARFCIAFALTSK
ncbi:MAG: two-component system OmpR family sensor kinase [Alphaproteobacteria bacterium]|jgi:two-component system OmpR family sensor kinase